MNHNLKSLLYAVLIGSTAFACVPVALALEYRYTESEQLNYTKTVVGA